MISFNFIKSLLFLPNKELLIFQMLLIIVIKNPEATINFTFLKLLVYYMY